MEIRSTAVDFEDIYDKVQTSLGLKIGVFVNNVRMSYE